jgi:hypothetical protein
MAVLKFRAYYEEDDAVYRDVVIKHSQTFLDLHNAILKSYEFDNKHQGLFTEAMIPGSVAGKFLLRNTKRIIRPSH